MKKCMIIGKIPNLIFKISLTVVFLIVMLAGKFPNNSNSFLPSKSSLLLNINVNTNVDCFTCNYESILTDTIVASDNEPEDLIFIDGVQLAIPINFIDCHNEIMNSDLQEMLKADDYPHIFVKINNYEISKTNSDISKAEISLNIDGIDKKYSVDVANYNFKNKMFLKGGFPVNLNDFYIYPPSKFLGLVKVDHEIEINFALVFKMN
jgi:hypothetical protein